MRARILVAVAATGVALLVTTPFVAQAAGSVTSADIVNETIKSKDIKNDAIKGVDIADGSLTGGDVADGGLTGADVGDGSLSGADLAPSAVGGSAVQDDSLTGADIDESTLTIPNRAGKKTFAGVSFESRDGGTTKNYLSGGGISSAGGAAYFQVHLDLPQGARITRITFYDRDEGDGTNYMFLTAFTPATGQTDDLTFGTSSGASSAIQSTVLTPNTVVDNGLRDYTLLFRHGSTSPSYVLYGATVEYSFTATVGSGQKPPPDAHSE